MSCKHNKLNLVDGYFFSRIRKNQYDSIELQNYTEIERKDILSVMFICENCNYIMSYGLKAFDLMPGKERETNN